MVMNGPIPIMSVMESDVAETNPRSRRKCSPCGGGFAPGTLREVVGSDLSAKYHHCELSAIGFQRGLPTAGCPSADCWPLTADGFRIASPRLVCAAQVSKDDTPFFRRFAGFAKAGAFFAAASSATSDGLGDFPLAPPYAGPLRLALNPTQRSGCWKLLFLDRQLPCSLCRTVLHF